MKNKGILSLVGFIIAGIGFLALGLSLVSLKLSFLTWIDHLGPLSGFVIRLLMIIVGIVLIFLDQTDFEGKKVN